MDVYKESIKKWGESSQVEMTIEELSECILALQKFKRDPKSKKRVFDVCDEIADVTIMIEQLREIFPPKLIDERREYKLERLKERLMDSLFDKYKIGDEKLKDLDNL